MSYDLWKTTPPEPPPECPECGEGYLEEDRVEECVECSNPKCDYGYGTDWDIVAERQAEARAERDADLYTEHLYDY